MIVFKKSLMASFLTIAMSAGLLGCQSLAGSNPNTQGLTNQSPNAQDAQDLKATATQNTLESYYLNNGLQVILKTDRRAPIVMTQIWYKAGSSDETKGKGGIAHFFEHMMFKDNALISSEDYHKIISQLGGQKNAFTTQNYTAYYEQLPANQYPVALQIEAARMQGVIITDDEVATENHVIQEERRQRIDSNPLAQAFEEFNKLSQPNSPKGRPVIGDMTDIQGLTMADLQAWYDVYYRPNNATLVLVGDFDADTAKRFIAQYFGDIKPNPTPIARNDLSVPSHQGYRHTQTHAKINVPNLIMGFNVPSFSTNPTDALALSLLQDIADGGLSARFEKNLIRSRKLLDGVSASYRHLDKGDTLFVIHAIPKQGVSLMQAQAAILEELSAITADTISDDEITRGQNSLQASLVFANDSIENQAQMYGMLASLDLPLDTIDTLPSQLGNITKAQIEQVNRRYLVRDNLTSMYVLPDSDSNGSGD